MQEIPNILRIFKEAKEALKSEDSSKLKDLSNQTIHTASITQDPDNVAVAVIIYSLSKIIEKPTLKSNKNWSKFYNSILMETDHLIDIIKNKDEKHLSVHIEEFRKKVSGFGNLKKYIEEVFRKASINKASRIYEHGISMERTAGLLGITLFELAGYAGQSEITEHNLYKTFNVKDRIKLAMGMFE